MLLRTYNSVIFLLILYVILTVLVLTPYFSSDPQSKLQPKPQPYSHPLSYHDCGTGSTRKGSAWTFYPRPPKFPVMLLFLTVKFCNDIVSLHSAYWLGSVAVTGSIGLVINMLWVMSPSHVLKNPITELSERLHVLYACGTLRYWRKMFSSHTNDIQSVNGGDWQLVCHNFKVLINTDLWIKIDEIYYRDSVRCFY